MLPIAVVLAVAAAAAASVAAAGSPSPSSSSLAAEQQQQQQPLRSVGAVPTGNWGLLSAPWTPFRADGEIDVARVGAQAAFHKSAGVTHVWAIGGMGQWSALSVSERQRLAQAWVDAGKKHNLFVDIHIGAQALVDARALALHAQSIGADAVAMIPPFAPSRPGSVEDLIDCMQFVMHGISLPLYYYHIPGQTGVSIKVSELLEKARGVVNIAGVKYVDDDLKDFQKCNEMDGGKYEMFWAPEPKLQSLPFGADKFVLAEAYYGPYLTRMLDLWALGDISGARSAQKHLNDLQSIICCGSSKSVMKMLGIDLGPPRLPKRPISQQTYDKVRIDLEQFGFFKENFTLPY